MVVPGERGRKLPLDKLVEGRMGAVIPKKIRRERNTPPRKEDYKRKNGEKRLYSK